MFRGCFELIGEYCKCLGGYFWVRLKIGLLNVVNCLLFFKLKSGFSLALY